MANDYAICTARAVLNTTREEHEELMKLLNVDLDNPEVDDHGFDGEWNDEGSYFFADSWGDPSSLPKDFVKRIGEILSKNGGGFLEFGMACYCDKARPGSASGDKFRIYAGASDLTWPTVSWPEG